MYLKNTYERIFSLSFWREKKSESERGVLEWRWLINVFGFPWCVWLKRPNRLAYQHILLPPKGRGGNLPRWGCWLASNHWRTFCWIQSSTLFQPFFSPSNIPLQEKPRRVWLYALINGPGRRCFHTAEWESRFAPQWLQFTGILSKMDTGRLWKWWPTGKRSDELCTQTHTCAHTTWQMVHWSLQQRDSMGLIAKWKQRLHVQGWHTPSVTDCPWSRWLPALCKSSVQ